MNDPGGDGAPDAPSDGIRYEVRERIAWITIDRSERAHALTPAGFDALAARFEQADDDPEVRVVVLTAAGSTAFCAGIDLKVTTGMRFPAPMRGPRRNPFEVVLETYKPTIASALRLNVGPDPYVSEDRIEGARAFAEKRAPMFTGR